VNQFLLSQGRDARAKTRLAAIVLLFAAAGETPVAAAEPPPAAPPPAATPPPTEPPPPVVDRAALDRADAALTDGRVDEACKLYDDVLAASPDAEVALRAGKCHELAGRTATAYKRFTRAALLAAGNVGLEDRARELASRLAPKLSKLRVDVLVPEDGLSITVNGEPLPKDQWRKLLPTDPGSIRVRAERPGAPPFEAQITLGGSADAQVVVVRDTPSPSDGAGGDGAGGAGGAGAGGAGPDLPPGDGRVETVSPIGVAAFLTTSLGLVGVATGIAFGVMTLVEVSDAKEDPALCPNLVCSKAGRIAVDEAEAKGIVSTIALSVGGASLATGVTLFVLRHFEIIDAPEKAPEKAPKIGVGPGWVSLELAF
jgi:hypothetical protein